MPGPKRNHYGGDTISALERLKEINAEMEKLRKEKKELKELRRGKGNRALFKDDWRRVNHQLHVLAKERSKLPLDLKWSAEEQKRRQEGDQYTKQKR